MSPVADQVATVTVAVPTYRRPGELLELLPALLQQVDDLGGDGVTPERVRLLVVDNDPDGSARPVADRFAPRVGYVVEAEPGIAAARNRALDEARGCDVLVMIDDDERPRPGWLSALLRTWADGSARPALVAGRVVAEYEGDLDPWIAAGEFFRRRSLSTGATISVAAAGNLLLDLGQLRRSGLRFETGLGLSGGEDTLLTRQLHLRGLRMVWCAESVVVDRVPAARMTRRWVLRRAWGHGNTAARVDLACARGRTARARVRTARLLGGLLRVGGGLGRGGVGLALRAPRHQARGLRTAVRGAGMVAGVVGHRHREYARRGPR